MILDNIREEAAYYISDGPAGSPLTTGWGARGRNDQAVRYDLLLQVWKPGMSIVEPGCGYGALLDRCAVPPCQYVGFDLVPELIMVARDLHRGYRFEAGPPDFKQHQPDVVLCSGVVSYLGGEAEDEARTWWIAWLRNAWNSCKVALAFNGARMDEVHPICGGVRWDHLHLSDMVLAWGGVGRITVITEAVPGEFTLLVHRKE